MLQFKALRHSHCRYSTPLNCLHIPAAQREHPPLKANPELRRALRIATDLLEQMGARQLQTRLVWRGFSFFECNRNKWMCSWGPRNCVYFGSEIYVFINVFIHIIYLFISGKCMYVCGRGVWLASLGAVPLRGLRLNVGCPYIIIIHFHF